MRQRTRSPLRKKASLALRASSARRPQYRSGGAIVSNAEEKKYGRATSELDRQRQRIYEDFRASLDKNSRAKLKGILVGASELLIEPDEPTLVIAIVDYKGCKVKIPAHDFLLPMQREGKGEALAFTRANFDSKDIKRVIKRRFGSEVDFRVTKILEDGTVLASRLKAMQELRQQWWFDAVSKTKDKDGKPMPHIRAGLLAKPRIVTVIDSGIYIELLGVESYIANKDLGHVFIDSARDFFKVGEKIDVVIQKVERNEDGQVRFWASNRLATLSRFRRDFDQIMVGDNFIGEVLFVNFDKQNNQLFFFVKIGDRVQVRCTMGKNITRIPVKGSVVQIRIINKFEDTLMLTGVMIHLVSV